MDFSVIYMISRLNKMNFYLNTIRQHAEHKNKIYLFIGLYDKLVLWFCSHNQIKLKTGKKKSKT